MADKSIFSPFNIYNELGQQSTQSNSNNNYKTSNGFIIPFFIIWSLIVIFSISAAIKSIQLSGKSKSKNMMKFEKEWSEIEKNKF